MMIGRRAFLSQLEGEKGLVDLIKTVTQSGWQGQDDGFSSIQRRPVCGWKP